MGSAVPVPYRELPEAARFRKYDIMELDDAPGRDSRPENFVPSFNRAEIVDHMFLAATARGGRGAI